MLSLLRHLRFEQYEHFTRTSNMSKPVLYYTILSPPVRAVLLTAAAIGLELELREVNLLDKEHLTPEYLKVICSQFGRNYLTIIVSFHLPDEPAAHHTNSR